VRDQTRLLCEFGTNPFSDSSYFIGLHKKNKTVTESPKNRTLWTSLRAVKITSNANELAYVKPENLTSKHLVIFFTNMHSETVTRGSANADRPRDAQFY